MQKAYQEQANLASHFHNHKPIISQFCQVRFGPDKHEINNYRKTNKEHPRFRQLQAEGKMDSSYRFTSIVQFPP